MPRQLVTHHTCEQETQKTFHLSLSHRSLSISRERHKSAVIWDQMESKSCAFIYFLSVDPSLVLGNPWACKILAILQTWVRTALLRLQTTMVLF